MSTYTPEEILSNRIAEAISQLEMDSIKWARENFLYGGTESDMRYSEELSFHRNEIKRAIGVETAESGLPWGIPLLEHREELPKNFPN